MHYPMHRINHYIIKQVVLYMFYYTSCGALAGKRLHDKAGCITHVLLHQLWSTGWEKIT